MDDLRAGFLLRVKRDAATLSEQRLILRGGVRAKGTLDCIKHVAHGLSGAGGIYGFAEISDAAANLEDAAIAELADPGCCGETDLALDALLFHTRIGETAGDRSARPASASIAANAD
jgi:chemotaxis protein histidine kinase CheA